MMTVIDATRIVMVLLTAMLVGCSFNVMLPENGRLADVHEAFPNEANMTPPPELRDAYERTIVHAPYASAYRAAQVGVTEAGLQLVSSDQHRGVILATAFQPNVRAGRASIPGDRRYFYAILAREKGPKRTELTIMVKAQQTCSYQNPAGPGNAMAAGFLTVFMLNEKHDCEAYSRLHWANDADNDKARLGRYVSAVRAQLIKAGYE
jgi:hypothetical protein